MKKNNHIFLIIIGFLLVIPLLYSKIVHAQSEDGRLQWVPDQLLVQFSQSVWNLPSDMRRGEDNTVLVRDLGTMDLDIRSLFRQYGVYQVKLQIDVDRVLESSRDKYPSERWEALAERLPELRHRYLLFLENSKDLDLLKTALERLNVVKKTSYNYYLWPSQKPNDTNYGNQWGLPFIGAEAAWDMRTNVPANILVGVIDGGFQPNHVDLAGNIVSVTDVVNAANAGVSGIASCDNHGTHVAGIIGAVGNNNQGMSGVFWSGSMALYRKGINNGSGNCTSNAGLYENAASDALADGVDIINNSWTLCASGVVGGKTVNWITDVIKVHENTVLLVNSADNKNTNLDPSTCVSNLSNVLLVAAATSSGNRASYSNYGAATVHLAAPGSNIYSSLPTNTYGYMSGTSMAAPMVAGVAALAWAQCPSLTVQQLRQAILSSVTSNANWTGLTITGGIVSASGAVVAAGIACGPNGDPDGDGLTNSQEAALGTNSNKVDTDGDGLSDGQEVNIYKTDPKKADTDGDLINDGEEVKRGLNPLLSDNPNFMIPIIYLLLN